MENEILNIVIIALVIAVIWVVVKQVFKLTAKVFSCGCIAIVVLAAIWFAFSFFNFF